MMDYQHEDDPAYWASVIEEAAYTDDVKTFRFVRDILVRLDTLTLKKATNLDNLLVNKSLKCLKEMVEYDEKDAIVLPRTYLYLLGRAIHYNQPSLVRALLDTIDSQMDLADNIWYFQGIRYNSSMGVLLTHPKMDSSIWDTYDTTNHWLRELFEAHRNAERGILVRFRASR